MLGIPAETPYDLRFRLLGIPVRVHPFFWLIMAAIGFTDDARATLIFVLCGFISILFHEFGHGMMSRVFGQRPSIVLYGMGGLCYYGNPERESPGRRFLVLICGPLAGFMLAGVAYAAIELGGSRLSPTASYGLSVLVIINLYWSALNLLPIWPLDGGQMSEVVLTRIHAGNGKRWAHIISLVLAGVLAILVYQYYHSIFMAFWFGYFAFTNYQVLQMLNYHARYGGYGD
jgi:Zn-dependent protease